MVLLSTLIHLFFIGVLSVVPFFKSKKTTYTPVYKVNLVRLPQIKKIAKPAPKAKPVPKTKPAPITKPVEKTKPVKLLTEKKNSLALAKLKTLEKKIKQKKPLEKKNDIEESEIPEMLAALDKIEKAENESGLIDESEKRKDKILEELNKLEDEWSKDKSSKLDFEKSKSLEQLEKLEKKWLEEDSKIQPSPITDDSAINEALAKLTSHIPSVSNQNVNETPSYLSLYFALIQNKAKSQWKNPSGIEILSEKETNKKTVVSFNIIRSGRIEDYKIDESSGNRMLDDLALEAVKNSDPLPPLPTEYHEDFLRVFLDFNYTLK